MPVVGRCLVYIQNQNLWDKMEDWVTGIRTNECVEIQFDVGQNRTNSMTK